MIHYPAVSSYYYVEAGYPSVANYPSVAVG